MDATKHFFVETTQTDIVSCSRGRSFLSLFFALSPYYYCLLWAVRHYDSWWLSLRLFVKIGQIFQWLTGHADGHRHVLNGDIVRLLDSRKGRSVSCKSEDGAHSGCAVPHGTSLVPCALHCQGGQNFKGTWRCCLLTQPSSMHSRKLSLSEVIGLWPCMAPDGHYSC